MSDSEAPSRLLPQTPSRRRRRVGEIFVMRFAAGFVTGRVVRTDASVFEGVFGANLLYIFAGVRAARDDLPSLSASNLLLPPLFTNNLGWSRGYFETIDVRDFADGEMLDQHCFWDFGSGYYDEYSRGLPGPVEPVGGRALASYLTIEDEVSEALGWGANID